VAHEITSSQPQFFQMTMGQVNLRFQINPKKLMQNYKKKINGISTDWVIDACVTLQWLKVMGLIFNITLAQGAFWHTAVHTMHSSWLVSSCVSFIFTDSEET